MIKYSFSKIFMVVHSLEIIIRTAFYKHTYPAVFVILPAGFLHPANKTTIANNYPINALKTFTALQSDVWNIFSLPII